MHGRVGAAGNSHRVPTSPPTGRAAGGALGKNRPAPSVKCRNSPHGSSVTAWRAAASRAWHGVEFLPPAASRPLLDDRCAAQPLIRIGHKRLGGGAHAPPLEVDEGGGTHRHGLRGGAVGGWRWQRGCQQAPSTTRRTAGNGGTRVQASVGHSPPLRGPRRRPTTAARTAGACRRRTGRRPRPGGKWGGHAGMGGGGGNRPHLHPPLLASLCSPALSPSPQLTTPLMGLKARALETDPVPAPPKLPTCVPAGQAGNSWAPAGQQLSTAGQAVHSWGCPLASRQGKLSQLGVATVEQLGDSWARCPPAKAAHLRPRRARPLHDGQRLVEAGAHGGAERVALHRGGGTRRAARAVERSRPGGAHGGSAPPEAGWPQGVWLA